MKGGMIYLPFGLLLSFNTFYDKCHVTGKIYLLFQSNALEYYDYLRRGYRYNARLFLGHSWVIAGFYNSGDDT